MHFFCAGAVKVRSHYRPTSSWILHSLEEIRSRYFVMNGPTPSWSMFNAILRLVVPGDLTDHARPLSNASNCRGRPLWQTAVYTFVLKRILLELLPEHNDGRISFPFQRRFSNGARARSPKASFSEPTMPLLGLLASLILGQDGLD